MQVGDGKSPGANLSRSDNPPRLGPVLQNWGEVAGIKPLTNFEEVMGLWTYGLMKVYMVFYGP